MKIYDSRGLDKASLNNIGIDNYDVIVLRDQKAQNTAGGTFTSGAWRTRDLNTEVVDTGNFCTLSSNQFTLLSGTYEIEAIVPAYGVDDHQARLQNITDGTTTLLGESAFARMSGLVPYGTQSDSVILGRFTITSSKTFEIQHQCSLTSTTYGFGVQANFTTEVYTQVFLRKTPATTAGLALTDASQAQQEAGTSTAVYTSPGRQQYHPSAAKGWINFNGTGTIAISASYNVTSITDGGTGIYTITWDVDFSSANYSTHITCNQPSGNTQMTTTISTMSAGSIIVNTTNNVPAYADPSIVCVTAFGDQ